MNLKQVSKNLGKCLFFTTFLAATAEDVLLGARPLGILATERKCPKINTRFPYWYIKMTISQYFSHAPYSGRKR
jgi:hypothetical protein